jgi:hypothetical protein
MTRGRTIDLCLAAVFGFLVVAKLHGWIAGSAGLNPWVVGAAFAEVTLAVRFAIRPPTGRIVMIVAIASILLAIASRWLPGDGAGCGCLGSIRATAATRLTILGTIVVLCGLRLTVPLSRDPVIVAERSRSLLSK